MIATQAATKTTEATGDERVLIATYGSLKHGFYNHAAMREDAVQMGNDKVIGDMYLAAGYPHLYHPTDNIPQFAYNLAREHKIEVWHINRKAYNYIYAMEIGAGYVEEIMPTKWGEAKIYFNPHASYYNGLRHIEAYDKQYA